MKNIGVCRMLLACAAALSVVAIPMAAAQSQAPAATSTLKVTVTDQSGTALENIEVTLESAKHPPASSGGPQPANGGNFHAAFGDADRRALADGDMPKIKTDKAGLAVFEKVAAGRYRITIKDDAYVVVMRSVQVESGKTISQQVKLVPKKK